MTAFTLTDLARRAGVSARTVRYYIQRGLLPAPIFRGPDTQYDTTHLVGLQAIRVLQDAYWPLDAIASALKGKSEPQLRDIAGGKLPPSGYAIVERRVSAPSSAATRAPARRAGPGGRRGTRFRLADGLELWIDEDASDAVQRLASAIRELAIEHERPREGGSDD